MYYLPILSFVVGAVFGMRFKVLGLTPLCVLAALYTMLVGLTAGLGIHLVNSFVVMLALQGGYIIGSIFRFIITAAPTGD